MRLIRNDRRLLLLPIAAFLLLLLFGIARADQSAGGQLGGIAVTAQDVTQAGYSSVTEQGPQGDMYNTGNLYFWVDGPSKSDKSNLLEISVYRSDTTYKDPLFAYGTNIHAIQIPDAQAQEGQLAGTLVGLDFAKGNYYVVIIGPTAQNVENLAQIVAGKI